MDPSPAIPALDLFSLRGQNVLITGATRGIGAACAIALAEAGASICLVQRHPTKDGPEPNLTTYNAIKALFDNDDPANQRTLEIVHCDLDNLDEVKGLFDRALEVFPNKEIHVLVNCAGIQRRAPAVDFGEKEWDEVLNVNLKSVFLLSQAAGRHMVPLRRGKIINFCSLLTFQGGFTVPAYAAAKGALGQLTKAFANEWSKDNVQVNGICPGYVKTDIRRLVALFLSFRFISVAFLVLRWRGVKGRARSSPPTSATSNIASTLTCSSVGILHGRALFLDPFFNIAASIVGAGQTVNTIIIS